MGGVDCKARNAPLFSRLSVVAMATKKKPIPPEDVIREKSEPPLTEVQEPPKKNPAGEVDIDDAQIDEPKDDAFRKAPQPVQAPKRRKKA